MTTFKVGDRVRVTDTSYPENVPNGSIGTIIEYLSHLWGVALDGKDGYSWGIHTSQMELIPQAVKLSLEDVYTVAPQEELREVINRKEPHFADPRMKDCIVRSSPAYIFWSTRSNSLNSVQRASHDTLTGKQEVSIPQFLTLLEAYANRKQEVKVQLNSQLEAVVDQDKQVVSVYYGHPSKDREPNPFTFQELRDFQQALKGGGHGFVKGNKRVGVKLPSYEVRNGIIDHLITCKVPMSSGCRNKEGYDSADLFWTGAEIWIGEAPSNTLTIDQFLAKCTVKPLPKLGGYEVTKTSEGNIKVGCQVIELERFEALLEAINQVK